MPDKNLFNRADLTSFLPSEAGDLESLRHTVDSTALQITNTDSIKPKAKVDKSRLVRRHRAGKPAADGDDSKEEDKSRSTAAEKSYSKSKTKKSIQAKIVSKTVVADNSSSSDSDGAESRRVKVKPHLITANTTSSEKIIGDSSSDSDSDSDDGMEMKRKRIKAQILDTHKTETETETESATTTTTATATSTATAKTTTKVRNGSSSSDADSISDSDSDSTSDSSSSDSSSSSEEEQIARPMFIKKSNRNTLKKREDDLEKERALHDLAQISKEEKKVQSQLLVKEVIQKEKDDLTLQSTSLFDEDESGMPNDSDNAADEEEELRKWEIRELLRLKKELGPSEAQLEKIERDRRRNLSDKERYEEDEKLGKFNREKTGQGFMQKYQHKGAFYMDEESMENDNDVRKKNYHLGATTDAANKAALPKVMQVKKFGFSNQTKYTHLADVDTTSKDDKFLSLDKRQRKKDTQAQGNNKL